MNSKRFTLGFAARIEDNCSTSLLPPSNDYSWSEARASMGDILNLKMWNCILKLDSMRSLCTFQRIVPRPVEGSQHMQMAGFALCQACKSYEN